MSSTLSSAVNLSKVPLDSELHFGASTRVYVIRERPNPLYNGPLGNSESGTANADGTNPMGPENRSSSSFMDDSSFGSNSLLPQSEVELDNLTEFNTAHNRRIASIVDVTSNSSSLGLAKSGKRKHYNVHFSDADEVINPEDVDPSVGRFRNLVQETFIPNKVSPRLHVLFATSGLPHTTCVFTHTSRIPCKPNGIISRGL
ncbi:hypothetical protein PHET_11408 [Paragonimus heterotremus]|uniref:Uncharacterized protein n=1 Tax=Paragonimus heterotremus TaxID=100268 RepID=A0A8J4WTC3_9TREM|nr:hypothetical protein PHET_11408 [Paragonimus heterotremus]